MDYQNTVNEITILLGVAVVVAFAVNYFSPAGIALIGQWDESQGVITAKAKNDVVVDSLELEDVKIAKQIYDKGGAIFVDARSNEDYVDGHVKRAVSLPIGQFDDLIDGFRNQYSIDKIIVTYCSGRTCDESHMLAQLLLDEEYTNVTVMIDGYPAWEKEGYPIE